MIEPTSVKPWFRSWGLMGYIIPFAVLAAGVGVTYEMWRQEWANIERETRVNFEFRTKEAIVRIEQRMRSYEQVLHAAEGLFQASGRVGREEFHSFTGKLRLKDNYPGIEEIGYCRFEPPRLEPASIATGGTPKAAGGARCPAVFVEAVAGNRRPVPGYDNFGDVVRREAMELARVSGKVAISNKVKLLGEDADAAQTGIRMYLPVYRKDSASGVDGWLYISFTLDALTESLIGPRGAEVVVEIDDDASVPEAGAVFDTARDRVGGESAVRLLYDAKSIEIGGYLWTITVRSLPDLVSPLVIGKTTLIARAGAGTALLLALLTWLVMRGRSSALLAARKLVERDVLLTAATQAAEAANLSKSRFLAAASHDLRQPLQSLRLLISVLKRRDAEAAHSANSALIGPMEASVLALKELLDSLLDISRLDAGAIQPKLEAVAVDDLLTRLDQEFRAQVTAKGLRLTLRAPRKRRHAGSAEPTNITVLTDPAWLMVILRNLISNACNYSQRGGILVGCRLRGGRVEVQVWDTGAGIPEAELGNIFEEYYQLDNPARDRAQGLGLGLAIVQRIAALLDHPLQVRSRVGRGTVFSVSVPLTAIAQSVEAGPQALPAPAAAIVLVLDNDREVLRSTGLFLTSYGYRPLLAEDLAEALRHVDNFTPNVILADYRLGQSANGIDAAAAICAHLDTRIPSIILTADTQPQLQQEADAAGCRLIHKPVDPDKLDAMLRQILVEPARAPAHERRHMNAGNAMKTGR